MTTAGSTRIAVSSVPENHTIITPQEEEKKKKKVIRQAIGVIVIDTNTNKILMLSNPKKEDGALRLPRGDCLTDPAPEHPEKAAMRILLEKAGVSVNYMTRRIGTYTEANKKGKITAHHWMFEVHNPTLLDTWPESDRERVWVNITEALAATEDRRMSHLALNNSSLVLK